MGMVLQGYLGVDLVVLYSGLLSHYTDIAIDTVLDLLPSTIAHNPNLILLRLAQYNPNMRTIHIDHQPLAHPLNNLPLRPSNPFQTPKILQMRRPNPRNNPHPRPQHSREPGYVPGRTHAQLEDPVVQALGGHVGQAEGQADGAVQVAGVGVGGRGDGGEDLF